VDISFAVVISDTCVRIIRDVVEASASGNRVHMMGIGDDSVVFEMPDAESADSLAQMIVRAVVEPHPEHTDAGLRVLVVVVTPQHVERIA
jgi:hypothetical protein